MLSRGKNHRETAIISRTSSPFNFQLSCDTCAAHTTSIETHVAWLARLKERKKNQRNQILIGKLLIVDFFHEQDRQEIATRSTTTGLSVATERLGYTLVQACARAPRSSFAQSVLRIVPIAGQIKRDTGVYTSYIASFL